MMKKFAFLALALAVTLPLAAQDWSLGLGTGPFVFGDFVERTSRVGTGEGPGGDQTIILTAGTRIGFAVDLERRLTDRWAIRAEGTFTNAPLRSEQEGEGGGSELDAGDLDVATFMLPIVFRINRGGAFRFHIMAGPAYAIYRGNAPDGPNTQPAFEDNQSRWGVAAGAGVGWWISDRFAIEGNITDITTSSPFDEEDFPPLARVDIKRPHNVHTTVGVRWMF
ncbi:MAG TPA: outer membrane beta-barrel protein [Thermoanaerobaculia bacterium]|nr:outer membrane beta-barrel protein [Thermoanaerobaculia bacterium]